MPLSRNTTSKRLFDILVSLAALVLTSPVLLVASAGIWLGDRANPFYLPLRIGQGGVPFRLFKLRSMVVDADRTGVDTTARADPRITPLGHFIRATKLDELPQFANVLRGDMSIVGPRPQVPREVALYSAVERGLLDGRPGITDLSSIVFADLADIVDGAASPDLAYNQLVRPWKSRLGLFYLERRSLAADAAIVALTALAIVHRRGALSLTSHLVRAMGGDEALVAVARRDRPLTPTPPPGLDEVITHRVAG